MTNKFKHISPKTEQLERCVGPLSCRFNKDGEFAPHFISHEGKLYLEDLDGVMTEVSKKDVMNDYFDKKYGRGAARETKRDFVSPVATKVADREDTAIWKPQEGEWASRPFRNITEAVAKDGTKFQVGSFTSEDGYDEHVFALNVQSDDPDNYNQELFVMRNKRADVEVIRSRMIAMNQTHGSLLRGNIEYASDNRPTLAVDESHVDRVNQELLKGFDIQYSDENVTMEASYFVRPVVGDPDGSYSSHYRYEEVNRKTGEVFTRVEVYRTKRDRVRGEPHEMNPRNFIERMRTLSYRDSIRRNGGDYEYNGSWEKVFKREDGNLKKVAERFGVTDEMNSKGEIFRNGKKMPTNAAWNKLDIYKKERIFKDEDIFELSKYFKSIK